jgi:hypothetical protein
MVLAAGIRLGPYEVVSLLCTGRMGEGYRARAFGCVLFELLSGRRLVGGATVSDKLVRTCSVTRCLSANFLFDLSGADPQTSPP